MIKINIMESMLDEGQDNALLRFSMGSAFIKYKKYGAAAEQLALAVKLKPDYSAARKLYGQALAGADKMEDAITAFKQGIDIAKKNGDIQAVKEMQVFLNRLKKNNG